MPWSGAGTYSLPAAYTPEVNGTTIDATRYNGATTDIATAISACLAKNGENVPTANLPMGGLKHTGAAAGSATGQYLVYAQSAAVVDSLTVTTTATITGLLTLTAGVTGRLKVTGGAYTVTSTVAFSATPTFDAAVSNYFELGNLTANVNSMTISNAIGGQTVNIRVKQDGTGGRTVAGPGSSKISGACSASASTASILTMTYSTADSRWEGAWTVLPT